MAELRFARQWLDSHIKDWPIYAAITLTFGVTMAWYSHNWYFSVMAMGLGVMAAFYTDGHYRELRRAEEAERERLEAIQREEDQAASAICKVFDHKVNPEDARALIRYWKRHQP